MDHHHSTAPAHIRERIRLACQDTRFTIDDGNIMTILALGWLYAVRCAVRYGYVIPASEIPTPAHDELARLERDEPTLVGRFRATSSLELQYEKQARHEATLAERVIPERHAANVAAQEKHRAATKREELERRTTELIVSDEAAAAEKRRSKARAQAEKEHGQ